VGILSGVAPSETGFPAMPIDTTKVRDRRSLKFETSAQALADAASLDGAENRGGLRRLGNWTLGQALGHLAAWIGYAYDGYPPEVNPPRPIRFMARLMKRRFLRKPLPVGFRMPSVEGGTLGVEILPSEEGLRRFRAAWDRLEREAPVLPSPIFGPLTHEEWKAMHLRHAELHLSFFVPR